MDASEKISHRQNTVRTDQANSLDSERYKRHKVDRAQQTQEQQACDVVRFRPNRNSPQQTSHLEGERSVPGDQTIRHFAERTCAGEALVDPEQPALIGEGTITVLT